jgi:outer membrane protein assembly factor BamA
MLTARLNFESYEVEDTPNRYISDNIVNPSVFERQSFAGIGAAYDFKNYDNFLVPTLGLGFHFSGYWNTNISDFAQNVPMVQSQLNLVYKLIPSAQCVFETTLRTKSLFGTTYEFYQAASVGGDYDLRGFRENRFTGRTAFTQTSDIRYSIGQIKNPFAPVTYGAFVGFDYGRVWIPTETSDVWHTSTGIGIWFTSSNFIASKVSYFHSEDGGRIAFGMKFNF